MFRTKYGVYVPSTTKLRRGICQRQVDRNKFRPLLYASCSPLTRNFFAQVCSRYVFPLCLGVVLPCRDVCFSIYKSCQHISLSPGLQRLEFLDFSKLPARPRLCLSPPSPTPWFSVPSASSVWSTSLSPSSPSVSRYYCFIILSYTGPAPDQEHAVRFTENSVSFFVAIRSTIIATRPTT